MAHAYPEDLAERVLAELHDDIPCLPDALALRTLLSIAYQGSLLREEERPVTFRLLVASPTQLPETDGPPRGLHRLVFDRPRVLDEQELRRIAPAAKFHRALVGIDAHGESEPHDGGEPAPGSALRIWGLVHSGPAWLRAIQGGRGASQDPLPFLTIAVPGPGRVVISLGDRTIAKLSGGRLSGPTADVFGSVWLPAMFTGVRAELHEGLGEQHGDTGQSRLDPDFTRVLDQHYVRRIIATIRLAHHGGTIVIVPPARASAIENGRFIQLKYRFNDGEPRRRFRTLVARLLGTLAAEHAGAHPMGWSEYGSASSDAIRRLDEGIFELAHLVASLADVDGAVVMTQRFEVLGFAGEITGELADVPVVARALDLEGDERAFEPTDGVGTRHRSVYRLCQALRDALAIVVSQDGGVRFVRWKDDAVTYWDQVATSGLDI